MLRLVKYIQNIRSWSPFKAKQRETAQDILNIVEQEVESNKGITLVVHKFGRQLRSRVIFIPLKDGNSVMLRRIGKRCQGKKGDFEFEIDMKTFNGFWRTCIDKKYKYIVK